MLPDIGVLSKVDLVSTERGQRLRKGRKNWQKPECESIVDEGGDRPDDKEGKGDWKNFWVEAVEDGKPQNEKKNNQNLFLEKYFSVVAFSPSVSESVLSRCFESFTPFRRAAAFNTFTASANLPWWCFALDQESESDKNVEDGNWYLSYQPPWRLW